MKHSPIVAAAPALPRWADRAAASRWTVPAIVALGLALRLALVLAWPQTPFSDGAWYLMRAGELARGLGYQEAGHPTAFWPVGFPALLYAIYPAAIVYAGAPLSEVASTAVAMAAFALLIAGMRRWPLLVLSGIAFGAATLMRAQTMFFPAGAIVALLLVEPRLGWRRALRAAVIVHLALAAVVLPWTLRNERVLGSPVLVSTNGGVALFTGAYDGANGDWTGWESTPVWNESGIPYAQRVERQVELDARFKALAKRWIAGHPLRWTLLGGKKVALLWRKDSDAFWSMHESYPGEERGWTIVALADQLLYFAMLALAVPALVVGLRGIVRRRPTARLALLGVMPAFATLTAFAFTGQIRYHFPAMPFVAIAAGWTLAALVSRRSGSGRPAA